MGTGTVIKSIQHSNLISSVVLSFSFVCVCVCPRKFHGYNSLKEYYEEESCMRYLHRVSDHVNSGNSISELVSPHPAPPVI